MKNRPLRRKIQYDKRLNPFSKDFDIEAVKSTISEHIETISQESKIYDLPILITSIPIGFECQKYYGLFENLKTTFLHDKERLLDQILQILNRNYLLFDVNVKERIQGKKSMEQFDLFRMKAKSVEPEIGEVELISGLEAEVDGVNLFLNFFLLQDEVDINEEKEIKTGKENELEYRLMYCLTKSIFFYILKESFDDCVWNNGYIRTDTDSSYTIDYVSHKEQLLFKAGIIRMQRNELVVTAFLLKEKDSPMIKKSFLDYRENIRPKLLNSKKGYLKFRLAKGFDKNDYESFLKIMSLVSVFYPFVYRNKFDTKPNRVLNNIIHVFSAIQSLVGITNKHSKTKNQDRFDYANNVVNRVDRNELIQYLDRKLTISKKEIISCLEIISHDISKSNKIDLWKSPVLNLNNSAVHQM